MRPLKDLKDEVVEDCFRMSHEQLTDSAKYYLRSINRIMKPDYRPTEHDIQQTRIHLGGIIEIGSVMLRSDLEIALYWIRGLRKEWKQWVENRVKKIRSLVGTECWLFVPGEVNSEFLLQPGDNWHVQKDICGLPSRATLLEEKKSSLDDEELAIISKSMATNSAISDDSIRYDNIQDVINMEKFVYSNVYVELQPRFFQL